jgi:hypothetical protein
VNIVFVKSTRSNLQKVLVEGEEEKKVFSFETLKAVVGLPFVGTVGSREPSNQPFLFLRPPPNPNPAPLRNTDEKPSPENAVGPLAIC